MIEPSLLRVADVVHAAPSPAIASPSAHSPRVRDIPTSR